MLSVGAVEYTSGEYRSPSGLQTQFSDYMEDVRNKIQKNWNDPELLEQGKVILKFKIARDGELYAYDVKESSGNLILDEFAIEALQKSAPFGEFPADTHRDYLNVQFEFDSTIVKTDKMKELVAQSEKFMNIDNKRARNIIDEAIKEAEGDCVAYFLYARRHKLDKLLCDADAAQKDLAECKRLKNIYNKRRIQTCMRALEEEETPFGHFALANAYDLAGEYKNALFEIEKAIAMTELNQAYKRYRAEIAARIK